MDKIKIIEILEKIKYRLELGLSSFFCTALDILVKDNELTNDEKEIVLDELWKEKIATFYDGTSGRLNSKGRQYCWYENADPARMRNLDNTITRLKSEI